MNEEVEFLFDETREQMDKAIARLETELLKVRAGRASSSMLEGIHVDYYGAKTPLVQVASVTSQDARTLIVQPWEKTMLDPILKAIQVANLGLNPQNDGVVVRINIPPLTEERRRDLVKKAKAEGENCKVILRTARRDANEAIKKFQKNGMPEDECKDAEAKVQTIVDSYVAKCDKLLETKEKDIMTV